MDEPPSLMAAIAALPPLSAPAQSDVLSSLFWVVFLISVNALFVAAEFSLVSVRRSRIAQLVDEDNRDARHVNQAQENLDPYLSAIQLCITIASLALGWIGATRVAGLTRYLFSFIPGFPPALTVPLTFGAIAFLQVIIGELVPKTLAITYPERTSLSLIRIGRAARLLLGPFVTVLGWSSNALLRLLRVPIPSATQRLGAFSSAEELQLIIASSNESGTLEEDERELLTNVFEFGDSVASEVMIPRTSIDAVEVSAIVRDLLQEVSQTNHSRYPVIGESLDDIRGTLYLKEVASALGNGEIGLDSPIQPFVRETHFVHQNKPVGELLSDMQQYHHTLVTVVDEFGGTAGLITLHDLVEEIVGRIEDEEGNGDEPDFQTIDPSTTLVQAQVSLDEVNEQLGLQLPQHDDYQTLGGFLIYRMQKIPTEGDCITWENLEFTVESNDGPRLDRIQISRISPISRAESHTAAPEATSSLPAASPDIGA
ncbi:MAG: hemolysin family protein [Cyanobacteria bacterium J06639_1]